MKKLHFEYDMVIQYSIPVSVCHYTIKCFPKDTKSQRVSGLQLRMYPDSRPNWSKDSFENTYIFGCNEKSHTSFSFHVDGDVERLDSDYECDAALNDEMIYRHSHGLNVPGEKIVSYMEQLKNSTEYVACNTNRDVSEFLMHSLYRDFVYEAGITDMNTSAEEAFLMGKGVCQDYAHIMIALCHLCKIPARYVTGFMIGEGKSHAWVEILEDGKWYGFDPTNDKRVLEDYIRIGSGRDAADCLINRGIMHGGGLQQQMILVLVHEQ